jgi:hypothetical protein
VQLYVHQKVASVTRPIRLLKAFERVTLRAGEVRTVEFRVTPEMLSLLNADMHRVVEPGLFELMVGPSSAQTTTVRLAVTGVHGETGMPPLPPPPAGSESGLVSAFDDGKVAASYGAWRAMSDAMMGGKSTAAMEIVAGGANGSPGALRVTGEVVPGAQYFNFAGVVFTPGPSPSEGANLSSKKQIAFWAKGDGGSYSVVVTTETSEGQMPPMKAIVIGPEWKEYSFPISAFDTDGHDMTGLGVIRTDGAGRFELLIDQVEIK